MIRYSEFKSAGKLPKNIPSDCAVCIEKDFYNKFNCDGEGNPKYEVNIGAMFFYQCPLSIPDQDAVDIVDLIIASDESGIPVVGNCLLDQTRAFFDYRRIIRSEMIDCQKELSDMMKKDHGRQVEDMRSRGTSQQSVGASNIPRAKLPPVSKRPTKGPKMMPRRSK